MSDDDRFDIDRLDEVILALLWANSSREKFGGYRAWKVSVRPPHLAARQAAMPAAAACGGRGLWWWADG
jgi:hypothetical protein